MYFSEGMLYFTKIALVLCSTMILSQLNPFIGLRLGTNMLLHALEQVLCEYVCFGRDGNIGVGYSM